jgi:hypothetical protein
VTSRRVANVIPGVHSPARCRAAYCTNLLVVDYPVLIPWHSAVSVSHISQMKILQEVSHIQNFMIHVLPKRQTSGKHVKSFRRTVVILDSKKTRRKHAVTVEEWTKLMSNKVISEKCTGWTYTANGHISIIQNGPQETCCIYIHMRHLVYRLRDRAWKNEFCEWYLHVWRRNTTPTLVLSGEA